MRRLWSFVFFCSVLVGFEAWAQNGGLRGTVVDEDDRPVEGVAIELEFLGGVSRVVHFETDSSGTFVRMGIRLGDYRLTLRKEGYQAYTEELKIPGGAPKRIGTLSLIRVPTAVAPRVEPSESAELQARFAEGNTAVDAGNYPAAIVAFEKALELAPESAAAYFNLGVVYGKMEETEKAIEHFEKATELKPGYYEAYVAVGDIYSAQSRWPETLEALAKAIEARPSSAEALYNYGGAALNGGELLKAREAFEKLLSFEPDHAAGHYQLGMIFVNLGEQDAAIPHLEKYLELAPEGPQAASAKGILDYLKKN